MGKSIIKKTTINKLTADEDYSTWIDDLSRRYKLSPLGGETEVSASLPPAGGKTKSPLFCIPWSHHKAIIDSVGTDNRKGFFFVCKTLQNQWGRGMLLNMLNSDLYEVQGKAENNFNLTLPTQDADLTQDLKGQLPTEEEISKRLSELKL